MLAMLATFPLVAQDNFLPGTIITTSGDTLQGKINYLNWDPNPTAIWFYNNATQDVVTYKPNELRAFKVAEKVYYGCEVEVETSSRDIGWMTSNTNLNLKNKVVFLKELFNGPKSLYHYRDEKGIDFFYIKIDDTYKLLIYKQMLDYTDGKSNIRESKRYVGQLLYYLSERPDLQGLINQTMYTESSLLNVFEEAYPSDRKPKSKDQVKKVTYGATLGLSYNRMIFSGSSFPELWYGVQMPPLSLRPGLFVEFSDPKNLGQWSLYSELQYDSYKLQNDYSGSLYRIKTTLNLDYLRLNTMMRYKIRLKKGYLFVNGGFNFGYIVREVNTQTWYSKLVLDRIETKKALDDLLRLETGLTYGIGASFNRFVVESRMVVGSGPSTYASLLSQTRSASLIVGYRF